MDTQILIKIPEQDKELIKTASKNLGLGHSTFCRMASLEKARMVMKGLVLPVENTS